MIQEDSSNSINPEENIVYNPESVKKNLIEEDTIVDEEINYDSNQDDDENNKSDIDGESDIVYDESALGPEITYDQIRQFDVNEYSGRIGNSSDDVFIPEIEDGIQVLNSARADNQAWYNQAGNMLGQAAVGEIIGGTIEGLGYALDVGSIVDIIQGDEAEWGNFMTDIGQGIREGAQSSMPIYEDPNAVGFGKMTDTGWWATGLVSAASTFSMFLPTMGVMKAASLLGKGFGLSKGMRALRKARGMAEKMGKKSRWMTNGISQAILSRNIENWMEAHGTFEDLKSEKLNEIDPNTGEIYTEEEAIRIASEAASSNYKKGWVMLLQDIPQYLAIGKVFNPATGKFEKALKAGRNKGIRSKMTPWQDKSYSAAKTFFGEGGEESYQYMISEQSKLLANLNAGYITQKEYDDKIYEAFGSEEMLTSAFFGGLGGNLFQSAGPALKKALKSKSQKEYEKNLEESYSDHIKNRAGQLKLMYQHLSSADQSGSKKNRDYIINESLLGLAVESLESDRFEQFYDTLGLFSEMSEEDANSYKEQTGEEFSRDLAKENAPKLQEMALNVREKYLKHRNNYNKSTSSKLSLLEMHNEKLSIDVEDSRKKYNKIKSKMGSQFDMRASNRLKKRLEIRERGQVLKNRKKELNNRLKKTSSSEKPFIQSAIDNNESLLKQQAKDEQKQRQETLDRTPEEKEKDSSEVSVSQDKAAEKLYNKSHKDEVLKELNNEARAREQIIINNEDMAFTKSKEGERTRKEGKIKDKIDSIGKNPNKVEAIKELKDLREIDIPESEILDDDKNQLYRIIDAKIKELKKEEEELEDATNDEKDEINRLLNREKDDENVENPDNEKVDPDVENNIEDYQFQEEVNSTAQQEEKIKEIDDAIIGESSRVAILDRIEDKNGNSPIKEFDDWMLRPFSKVGKIFNYTADVDNPMNNKSAVKAYKDLKKRGLKKGEKIPQEILDRLIIKVSLKENDKVFSFIPGSRRDNDKSKIDDYNREYRDEREVIIRKLLSGEEASSEVTYNTGGELKVDYDNENKVVPEYSILDIQQFGGDMSKIELLVTDKDGRLVKMDGTQDDDLGGKRILLNQGKDDSKLPYKGGLFLKVKRANGTYFALKLNQKRVTDQQADVLADILIEVGVTSPDKDKDNNVIKGDKGKMKVSKKIKLSTALSSMEGDLKDRIMDVLAPEVEMLDKKYKDPTIKELIGSLVYMSERTKDKKSALFMDGNDLKFGKKNTAITLLNRDNPDVKASLVEFLLTQKRRQFDRSMWQNKEDYKEFIVNNRIINTNATISGPLFVNTRKKDPEGKMIGIRAQIYLKPLRNLEAEVPSVNTKGEVILSNNGPSEPKVQKITDDKIVLKEETFSIVDSFDDKTVFIIKTHLDGSLSNATIEEYDSSGDLVETTHNFKMKDNKDVLKNGITAESLVRERLDDGDIFRKTKEKKASQLNSPDKIAMLTADQKSRLGLKTRASQPTKQTSSEVREVADGIKIIDNALTSSEEAEIFQMIKPFLESQGSRSNKGKSAPVMIGMGLRWDYKSNNPGKTPVKIKETIVNTQGQRNKYAYYDVSIDGESLGEIPARLKELMTKATGIDASNYDGAIINIYPKNGFISAHNDVDESATAINYPVIVANIGGSGSLSVEGAESQEARKGYSSKEYVNEPLSSGSAYVFGEGGKNRNVFHRTLPSPGKGNLPQLNVKGQIIPANSYRISVTLRRVKDLEPGMPTAPNKITQPTKQVDEVEIRNNVQEKINKLKSDLNNLDLSIENPNFEESFNKKEKIESEILALSKGSSRNTEFVSMKNEKGVEENFTVKGNKFFNSKGNEVFKEPGLSRNKISANLALKRGTAKKIRHKDGNLYIVNNNQTIMSAKDGNIMNWGKNNPNRKEVLAAYSVSSKKENNNSQAPFVNESYSKISSTIFELDPNITQEKIIEIYKNYASLMNRGEGRKNKEISISVFKRIIKKMQVFKHKDTYIFGNYDKNSSTFVTRINSSPSSKELLAEALPALGRQGLDFISFVPKDVAEKYKRSGYSISSKGFNYNFKGEKMVKYAAMSSPNISKKIFNKSINELSGKEMESFNSSQELKYNAVEINGKLVEKAGKDLSNIMETYLGQFGIVVKDINEMKDNLGIDELGFADLLSRIAYVKNKEDLPPVAGEFIAYMMQYNDLVTQIIRNFSQTKDYQKLDKSEYFKIIGGLISKDLQNKLDGNYSKSLIEKLKELIKNFFSLLKETPIDQINKNIGIISNNIMQQNKKMITASLYKPGEDKKETVQVTLDKAMKSDKFGASIINTLSKEGFILTGSTALGEQGTIQRPDENLLHDIDWVSPFSRKETKEKFLSKYPNATFVREIKNEEYNTDTWVIAPKGHTIKNYASKNFNGKIKVDYYEVFKGNKRVGTYKLNGKKEDITGTHAKIVDFFSYEDYQGKKTFNIGDIKLANWRDIFNAKLDYARIKDVWDYNRFVPNEYKNDLSRGFKKKDLPKTKSTKTNFVKSVYSKIDDDSYSISLNYKNRDYDMAISRDGEIVDPNYYDSNKLRDIDVDPRKFRLSKTDLKNIFLEIDDIVKGNESDFAPIEVEKYVERSFKLNEGKENERKIKITEDHYPGIDEVIKTIAGNPKEIKKFESEDKKNRYYVDKNNKRYIGMSSIVNPSDFDKKGENESESKYQERLKVWNGSQPIGNAVDSALRMFFDGKTPSYNQEYSDKGEKFSERITKEAFDSLLEGAKKYKEKVERKFGKENTEFLTEGLFIADDSIVANQSDVDKSIKSGSEKDRSMRYGFATEFDMVVVNKKTGSVHLVDFKTKRTSIGQNTIRKLTTKWATKSNPSVKKSSVDGYSKQQNASRILLEKMEGIKFDSMSLLAVATRYEEYGQQTRTATVQETSIPLEEESIEDVFPGKYKDQVLGKASVIDDINEVKANENSLPLNEGTSFRPEYIKETFKEESKKDLNDTDDDDFSFADEEDLNYNVSPDKSLSNMDDKSGEIKCINNK